LGIARIRDGNITVIHSLGILLNRDRGVEEITLANFLQAARNVGVFRTKSIDGALISDRAMYYLGRPFDWSFNIFDDSRIYCTELLFVVLKTVAPEIKLSTTIVDHFNWEIIPLDSISNSDYFDEIFYIGLNEK